MIFFVCTDRNVEVHNINNKAVPISSSDPTDLDPRFRGEQNNIFRKASTSSKAIKYVLPGSQVTTF